MGALSRGTELRERTECQLHGVGVDFLDVCAVFVVPLDAADEFKIKRSKGCDSRECCRECERVASWTRGLSELRECAPANPEASYGFTLAISITLTLAYSHLKRVPFSSLG